MQRNLQAAPPKRKNVFVTGIVKNAESTILNQKGKDLRHAKEITTHRGDR